MNSIIKKTLLLSVAIASLMITYTPTHSAGNITDSSFTIEASWFTPRAWSATSGDMRSVTDSILENVIDSPFIAFWVLSLLVMVIWAWHMIIYTGQEDLLSKWKKIFMAGIISLSIALLSWLIVNFVNYLLYN